MLSTKESIHKIREICAIKYNSAALPSAIQKCKKILTDLDQQDHKCLCAVVTPIFNLHSIELATQILSLVKQDNHCKFCQIKIDTLYDLMKRFPFYITQRNIPLNTLEKKPDILLSILDNHLFELTPTYIQDIVETLFANITEKIQCRDQMILIHITNIIEKYVQSKKRVKKDAIFILFYEIVKYVNQLAQHSEEIREFTLDLINNVMVIIRLVIQNNLLDQLDIYKISDLVFSQFQSFRLAVIDGFKILNTTIECAQKGEAPILLENGFISCTRTSIFRALDDTRNYIRGILVNYNRPIAHIDNHMFSFVLQLGYEDMSTIMRKVSANCIMHLISEYLETNTKRTFELYVNPLHMINSTICKNMNLSTTMEQFIQLSKKPYVIYENDNGRLGIDAGGLTRDFFSQYFLQLKDVMVPADDIYMTFGSELKKANSLARIRFAGVLTAYSMLREKMSPNLRFHPIISYFMVNGSTIQINHLLDYLAKFDIEYIRNLRKILDYSVDEFRAYLEMQGESESDIASMTPTRYLHGIIQDRYVTPPMIAFVRGFRDIFIQLEGHFDLYSFINPAMIQNYMVGIDSYRIFGMTNSLESILRIDCGEEDPGISLVKKQGVKQVFLAILDNLNRTDFAQMKEMMRFWHGTHAIHDFQHLDLTLRVVYGPNDLHGCFSSSTCFGKLYVHHSCVFGVSPGVLKANLEGHIARTLENQRVVESAGMYMQVD